MTGHQSRIDNQRSHSFSVNKPNTTTQYFCLISIKSYFNDKRYNNILPNTFTSARDQIIWSNRWPYNSKNYNLIAAIKIEMVPVY